MFLLKAIARLAWRIWGWTIEAPNPYNVDKGVLIVYPHTSNWDFPIGLMIRVVIDAPHIAYVGKDSLFKWPFGGLMRALGGVPVDRSRSTNFVDAVADLIKSNDRMVVCITPEGTRSKTPTIKTGFYYMALKAEVPLIMVQFDWKNKFVHFREPYHLTGNWETDYQVIADYFQGVEGYHPHQQYDWDPSTVRERYPRQFSEEG